MGVNIFRDRNMDSTRVRPLESDFGIYFVHAQSRWRVTVGY